MPPRTLTKAEFLATPVGRKPGASYEKGYLPFIAKRRAAKLGTVNADPLAPTPEPTLRAQTTQAVRAQIDPILAEITRSTDRAAGSIGNLTETHASRLKPFAGAARERYGRAAEASAGVATTFADRLAGRGTEEAGGLKEKLAAINAPDALVNEIAGGTAGFARGAANAGFGIDSAALEELIAHGATAEDFAASLPGIARVSGIRSIGDVRGEGMRQLGEVRGKVPGLIAELMEGSRDREVNKGIARLGLQETRERTAAQQAADAAAASASSAAAAAEDAKPDSALSNTVGYLVDSNGIPLLAANGQPIPTQGALDDKAGDAKDRQTAIKARTDAVVAAKTQARTLARTLFKGEKSGEDLETGKPIIKRKGTAEAIRLVMNEIQPSLARYGIKPGTRLYQEVRAAVIDAVIDAGFPVGAKDPTVAKPAGAAAQKPRGG